MANFAKLAFHAIKYKVTMRAAQYLPRKANVSFSFSLFNFMRRLSLFCDAWNVLFVG